MALECAVCGVDVYRTPHAAAEDGVEIDLARPFPFKHIQGSGMFFSGRYYRLFHPDHQHYDPQSSIPELRDRLKQLKPTVIGMPKDASLEQQEADAAYILTPLNGSELSQLLRPN